MIIFMVIIIIMAIYILFMSASSFTDQANANKYEWSYFS